MILNLLFFGNIERESKMNYSKLEGKEIIYIDHTGTKTLAIIAGFDKAFGLTIQEKETKKYLMCLVGYASPACRGLIRASKKGQQKLNALAAKMIVKGEFNFKKYLTLYESLLKRKTCYNEASAEYCPFSQ
jgi:hypothetical protein